MRLRIKPRDTAILDLIAALAEHLPAGADLLGQVVGSPPGQRAEFTAKLKEVESRADESTHAILRRVNETFVTPFDRDDIYELASHLDDCMDFMEEVADRIVLYHVGELPEGVVKQVEILQRCSELTADAMPRLRTMKDLRDFWVEINSLENEGDRIHRHLLRSIFDGSSPAGLEPLEVLKLKEVADDLENAVDAFERVANVVETIVIKEA